jgi:hypothetical protein
MRQLLARSVTPPGSDRPATLRTPVVCLSVDSSMGDTHMSRQPDVFAVRGHGKIANWVSGSPRRGGATTAVSADVGQNRKASHRLRSRRHDQWGYAIHGG